MVVISQMDTKAKVGLNFISENGRTFFIRFYDQIAEEEFVEAAEMLAKRDACLVISKKDGTYVVREFDREVERTQMTAWDILMHKAWSLSNEIRKDQETGQKYYIVRFSDQFIKPCARLAV